MRKKIAEGCVLRRIRFAAAGGALALSAVLMAAGPATAAVIVPDYTATGTDGDVVGAYGRGTYAVQYPNNVESVVTTIAVTDTATDSHGARLYIRFGLATGGSSSAYSVSASGKDDYQTRTVSFPRINISNGEDAIQVKECLTEAGGDYSCGSWSNAHWLR
ncbi:hypothetical protein ACFCX4_06340 [Kitasatospora sp. NPDC056327]|uniref:hypothetical protein n=1 Tax=Kitasatospora sp. NPDC056327 TaxID=3345785 RepID=UPI0035DB2140